MKLNSREKRANKIMHWSRFETWVTDFFLKRGKGTSPFFYFDNEKGVFSIKYDLARSCFQSFSKMEANYDVGRGILGQNIGFRFFDIYYLT